MPAQVYTYPALDMEAVVWQAEQVSRKVMHILQYMYIRAPTIHIFKHQDLRVHILLTLGHTSKKNLSGTNSIETPISHLQFASLQTK